MTLTNLINDLKQAAKDSEIDRKNAQQLIDERVILPEDFKSGEVELKRINLSKGEPPLYHLLISSFPKRSLDNVQPLLDDFFSRAKGLRLRKGVAELEYRIFWTPEAFQDERRLTELFFDEVNISSRVYTCDPTKVRIGISGQSHEIKATTQATNMVIRATGNYRGQLEGLIETFNPDYAKLNLSKEDAERFLRVVRNIPIGKYIDERLEKALQPKERAVMNISAGGGINFGKKEIIELEIPISLLRQYEQLAGQCLIAPSPKQESHVTEFSKIYSPRSLLQGERLSDLQALARAIPKMDLRIMYGYPLLTTSQAREMLDKEIKIISDAYENMFYLGMNTHRVRGPLVKRLAREHFGDEIVDKSEELNVNDFINFLKARGYIEPRAEDVENKTMKEIHAKARAEGRMEDKAFANEPEYIAKERHLFEFFKQSYKKDPRESIQRFREFYQNKEPEMEIFTNEIRKDVSKLGKLKLPSQARLYSFGITKNLKRVAATHISNDLAIDRIFPSSDDVHFWCKTSVDSPILLPLQDYVCKEMGINFR